MPDPHHAHDHHAPGAAHPPQPAQWSLLRMALPARLGAACAGVTVLWLLVILAMR